MLLAPPLRAGHGRSPRPSGVQPSSGTPVKTKSAIKKEKLKMRIEKSLRGSMAKPDGKDRSNRTEADKAEKTAPMPKALIGTHQKSPAGKRICYGFNLGSCHTDGPRCMKGERICSLCFEPHPYVKTHGNN